MAARDGGPVQFDASDTSAAVDLLHAHATPPDDITDWIDIRPLDVPADRLPTTKGLLGRTKVADPPSAQIIWVDPATGRGDSTINLELPGHDAGTVVAALGPPPPGWQVEPAKACVIVHADVGLVPEQLVGFAVEALGAALGGWSGRYEATGVHVDTTHGYHSVF